MLRKFPATCNRQQSYERPMCDLNLAMAGLNLLMSCRHYKFLDDGDGQRSLVEHQVVELQHVEIFSRCGLIFLAEREPFAKSNIVCWQLRGA